MSKIIYLEEIALAKKVTKEFPQAIQTLDKCYNLLYNNKDYIDIARVLREIENSKINMELILQLYTQYLQEVKENK